MMINLLIMVIFHSYIKLPKGKMLFVENLFQLSRDDDSQPLGCWAWAKPEGPEEVTIVTRPTAVYPIAGSKEPSESNLPE
jgi:hypothetical protein